MKLRMSDIFPITQQDCDVWSVRWPKFRNIRLVDNKIQLVNTVFGTLGLDQAGFGIELINGEHSVLWMSQNDWAEDSDGTYSEHLQDMYTISSMVFRDQKDAELLQDHLEKRLVWRQLSTAAI